MPAVWEYPSRSTPADPLVRSKSFAASRSYTATGCWVRMFSSFTLTTPHQMNAETKTHVSIAPFTASRLASGLPYLGDLLAKGVQCSLSVDTTTVTGNADMFSVMRLMLQLNHLRSMNVLEVQ